jgi:hypothetical protein
MDGVSGGVKLCRYPLPRPPRRTEYLVGRGDLGRGLVRAAEIVHASQREKRALPTSP